MLSFGREKQRLISTEEEKIGQIHTTVYKINNKDLLCSTGNYIQYIVITYNGKESENDI